MSRRKSYLSSSQLTIAKALDILDVDKCPFSYRYEKRGAIMFLRDKLNEPPKPPRLRYGYYNEYIFHFKNGDMTNVRKSAVQTLTSKTLENLFKRYECCENLRIIIFDRWEKDRVIYDGLDYEKFLEVIKHEQEKTNKL